MKKKLIALFLASVSMISVAQARFYIGVDGAYTLQGLPSVQEKGKGIEFHTITPSGLKDLIKNSSGGYSVGVVLGSESFWGRYFGMRWGAGVGYSSVKIEEKDGGRTIKTSIDTLTSELSIDAMINFVNTGNFSFGVFGGVGAEYQYVLNNGNPKKHALDFVGRAGVSTLLGDHHRVELFTKLPFASMSSKYSSGDKNAFLLGMSKASFGASYKFVF